MADEACRRATEVESVRRQMWRIRGAYIVLYVYANIYIYIYIYIYTYLSQGDRG